MRTQTIYKLTRTKIIGCARTAPDEYFKNFDTAQCTAKYEMQLAEPTCDPQWTTVLSQGGNPCQVTDNNHMAFSITELTLKLA